MKSKSFLGKCESDQDNRGRAKKTLQRQPHLQKHFFQLTDGFSNEKQVDNEKIFTYQFKTQDVKGILDQQNDQQELTRESWSK